MKNLNEVIETKSKLRRTFNRGYILALLAVLFQTMLPAQESTYIRQPGYWTLGINGGLSYQQSDIPISLEGYGVGLTLAKNLYYKPGAPFAFDLRGRALYAESYGLDYKRSYGITKNEVLNGTGFGGLDYTRGGGSTGFVFQNHSTKMGELGLEGVISFNRLRERTNVILSVFGGIGIDWYRTKTDQATNNGNLYATDYLGIDTTASKSSIRSNLKNILDGEYETLAEGFEDGGKLGIMPSLGLELGYQVTPKFSIGLGHKVTFARNDILDGQKWTNDNQATNDNDIHHYTNLHLRWIVQAKEEKLDAPIIQILEPLSNPYTSYDPNGFVKARIKNVRNAMDVDYTVNGQPVNFNFNRGQLTNSFLLEPGNNEVVITATNSVGRDQKKIIIAHKTRVDPYIEPNNDPIITPNPGPRVYRPTVNFTRPSRTTERVTDDQYNVQAEINHVSRGEDIYFTVNGQKIRNFDFNNRTGLFRTTINLREGNNKLFLEATNREGRANDNATIVLEEVVYNARPSVEITKPYDDPFNTNRSREAIEARIDNVEQKRDLTYKVNGRTISEFAYDGRTFRGNADLRTGRNTVEVIVKTQGGEDRDQVIIYYDQPNQPQLNPPVVTITSPSQNTTTRNDRKEVRATILNVDDKSDITFTVNNRRSYDFQFDRRNKTLTSNLSLEMGTNRIKILAQNNDGRDEATVEIKREKEAVISRPPSVNISKPKDNATVNQSSVDLEANVSNVSSKQDIQVFLNGQKSNNFNFNSARKIVTAKLNLKKGSNTIVVKVSNRGGKDEDQVRVNFKTANPPVVKFILPKASSTKNSKVYIKASVDHVNSKNEIQVFLNGKSVKDFIYSAGKKEVSANLILKSGSNKITVKAKTADGSDEDSKTITYIKTIAPPKVTILTPKNNSVATKQEVNLKANIENVTSAKDLTLLVNGKKVSRGLAFKNGVLTSKFNLKTGRNTISVKAVNKGGADEAKVVVNYQPIVQIPKPVVKFITPAKAGVSVRSRSMNIKASVLNILKKNNVEMRLNGRKVKKFTYNASKKELTATLKLKTGKNVIMIKATNAAGTASAETNVVVAGSVIEVPTVSAPKILTLTNSQPTVDPLNPDVGRSRLIATLQNVTKNSEITLTFNGVKVTNFTYSATSKKLEAIVDLVRGKNTINLKLNTAGGKDEETKNIVF